MRCPLCDGSTKVTYERVPMGVVGTMSRGRKCVKCKLEFKTSEKLIFSSMPDYIRERYLSEGKRESK